MRNLNIGIVNLFVSNKFSESYFNNSYLSESKELVSDFVSTIKSSPILQLEFKVFNNIENKYIEDDLIASRYIDNNVKLFEIYTIDEINKEHEKLLHFVNEDVTIDQNDEKVQLYNSIQTLINESMLDYVDIDVDKIHESFTQVLNHIKKPKNESEQKTEIINEEVINIAVDKFNKKYSLLNEDDKDLFQKLVKYTDEDKKDLFETYKQRNLKLLETYDTSTEKINKAIEKINNMSFSVENINNDIINLHELYTSIKR